MKKVISFVLTLVMMLGVVLIPSTELVCAGTPLPGFQISGNYVKLSGTQLVNNSGGASVVQSGHIYYDEAKNEITLDNVKISCKDKDGIYYNGTTDPLVINLVGNNIVTSSKYAIFGTTSVIITGSGVLRAEAGAECVALGSRETFTIGGGAQVNLYATYTSGRAISAAAIEIRDSEVTATAYRSTIYASEVLTITDGAVVKSIAKM